MQQYLINATAIWLISLIMFDVFLRRESYHAYNRYYLLFTFLLGALLPLVQWQDDSLYIQTLQKPVAQIITAKQTIAEAGTLTTAEWNWQQWVMIFYLCGVVVMVCLLIIDIIKLSTFYSKGKKSKQGNWTIVETGKEHAPFSFFNILFVSSLAAYDAAEWDMILIHEKRHTASWHFADLMLMQLSRIVFWFHPLVYIYNKRLLLVHEYQADSASAQKPQVYGQFLVEQALLQSAPVLSHSFNRSPIKNRIVMLTRKSSAIAQSKMLVFLPLVAVCILCFSKNSFSQKFVKNGNMVTYKGNTFELSEPQKDTIMLIDPVTGKTITELSQREPMPIKMNGNTILQTVDKQPYFMATKDDLQTYLLKNMQKELGKLEDGMYSLYVSDLVIDEEGKVVYFDYGKIFGNKLMPATDDTKGTTNVSFGTNAPAGMSGQTFTAQKAGAQITIDKDLQQEIFQKVCKIMNGNLFLPGTVDGKKVVTVDNTSLSSSSFKIKNHKIYKRKDGKDVALN